MMSKDTAQQEVEKVCFAYEKAGKTGNKKDWGKFYDLEDSLINKVEVANQTKLSIPKKIAEMLDVSFDFQPEYHEDISWIASNMDVLSDDFHYNEFYTWLDSGKDNYNIALAYLAGKALGVDLVKVVEG
ncbi:hypothetical protein [Lactococcus petauri]|uniref:hypothetical protein n=2 Tax=Lactococcus petauri TaxID=1940789 RepID=UPI0022E1947B|nr:hypothetical protein [Lactococcus petauri]